MPRRLLVLAAVIGVLVLGVWAATRHTQNSIVPVHTSPAQRLYNAINLVNAQINYDKSDLQVVVTIHISKSTYDTTLNQAKRDVFQAMRGIWSSGVQPLELSIVNVYTPSVMFASVALGRTNASDIVWEQVDPNTLWPDYDAGYPHARYNLAWILPRTQFNG